MTALSSNGRGVSRLAALACVALAAGALVASGVTGLEPGTARASSHREAPLISGQPQYDNTDVYAFVSPDKPDTTTIVGNFLPFQEPAGGPNFYKFADDAQYDIHIDSDGDAQGDLIYRWTFKDHVKNGNTFLYNTGPVTAIDDPDLNFTQTYDIDLLRLKNQHVDALHKDRRRSAGRTVERGQGVHAGLPEPARPGGEDSPADRRRSRVRPTIRSSPTCGSSTCSTARTSPRSATTRSRATTSTPSPCRCRPRTSGSPRSSRSSASGPPPSARTRAVTGSRCPGSACRWSTRSSSPSRTRTSSTRPARGTTATS